MYFNNIYNNDLENIFFFKKNFLFWKKCLKIFGGIVLIILGGFLSNLLRKIIDIIGIGKILGS